MLRAGVKLVQHTCIGEGNASKEWGTEEPFPFAVLKVPEGKNGGLLLVKNKFGSFAVGITHCPWCGVGL